MSYDLKDTTIQNLVQELVTTAGEARELARRVETQTEELDRLDGRVDELKGQRDTLGTQLNSARNRAENLQIDFDRRARDGQAQVSRLVADNQQLRTDLASEKTNSTGWRVDCQAAQREAQGLRSALAEANAKLERLDGELRSTDTYWVAKEDVDDLGLGIGIIDKDGDRWYHQESGGWHDTVSTDYAARATAGEVIGAWGFDNDSVASYFGDFIEVVAEDLDLESFRPAVDLTELPGILSGLPDTALWDLRDALNRSFNPGLD